MSVIRAQSIIKTVSAIPADFSINRFHFLTVSSPASTSELDEIQDRVRDFYDSTLSTTRRLGAAFSSVVAQNGHEVVMYDMADPEPRVPIREFSWNLSVAPSTVGYPTEVALVLSFQAERVSGIPQARRRNRIYFPFINTSYGGLSGNQVRPSANFITDLVTAGGEVLGRNTGGVDWVVRSETTGVTELTDNGWVDNAFDSQRRRGPAATSRTLFQLL